MPGRAERGNRGSRPPMRGNGGRSDARPRGPGPGPGTPIPRRTGGLGLRHIGDGRFELTHPRCVEELRLDFEEGIEIWKAGEPEEARDALRFALQGCGDNIWVHAALGRIALEAFNDPSLARGHFGYGYELAMKAIPADFQGTLPPQRPGNRPLFDVIDGLMTCHMALGEPKLAADLRAKAARLAG